MKLKSLVLGIGLTAMLTTAALGMLVAAGKRIGKAA